MRDIITHHYFDVDAEAIFDVCQNHIDKIEKNNFKNFKRNLKLTPEATNWEFFSISGFFRWELNCWSQSPF